MKGRKRATPYVVQVRRLLTEMQEKSGFGLVSAKTLLPLVEHSQRKKLSTRVGELNQVLHSLWAEGILISYEKDCRPLREPDHVAAGSAACDHPQIFGLPGTPSPDPEYTPTTYADSGHSEQPGPTAECDKDAIGDAGEGQEAVAEQEAPTEAYRPKDPLAWKARGPAPAWVPSALVEEWVTKPGVLAKLRDGLDKAQAGEKLELIQTGLRRKGTVSPNTPVAQRLARLCFQNRAWWDRCAKWAYQEYSAAGQVPSEQEVEDVPEALEGLREVYPPDALVLACILTGLDSDEVRLFALEAEEQLEQGPAASFEATLQDLRDRLRLSHDDLTAARAELRTARRASKLAERQIDALRVELARAREANEQLDGAEPEFDRVRAELAEALAANAELRGAKEELADEQTRVVELEERIGELNAIVEGFEAEAAAASDEAARRMRAEQDLQSALRTISEQNVQIAQLKSDAGRLPSLSGAASLAELLDAAVGTLVAEASARISAGEASPDDGLLLGFASQFLEFKQKVSATATAWEKPREDVQPPSVGGSEPGEALPDEHAAPPGQKADLPPELDEGEVSPLPEPGPRTQSDEAPADHPAEGVRSRSPKRLGWTVRPVGGAGEIGGSAIVVQSPSGEDTVLLDAGQRVSGLFGASRDLDFHFGVAGVERLDAILLSHAHIDHTGSLPVLHRTQVVAQGSPIPVYASEPTRTLAKIMMNDSAKIQHANQRLIGDSDLAAGMLGDRPAYDSEDVERVMESVEAVPASRPVEIPGTDLVARLFPVSHVLGSCAIHLTDSASGMTLLYTGDLGPISDTQLSLQDFGLEGIQPADVVITESTYGAPPALGKAPVGRQARVSRRERQIGDLCRLASDALSRNGFVLLPTFSLGRAQELARILHSKMVAGELPEAPMYVGGMAERIMEVYVSYAERRSLEGDVPWVRSGQFPRTQSLLHKRLDSGSTFEEVAVELLSDYEPGYILASPAMLRGGWSLTFANLMVDDARHAIIFTGYLPRDDRVLRSLGDWQKGSVYTLDGTKRKIECEWSKVGLSAHASFEDLRTFADCMLEKSPDGVSFAVVHGTPEAQSALATDIRSKAGALDARSLMNGQSWTIHRK